MQTDTDPRRRACGQDGVLQVCITRRSSRQPLFSVDMLELEGIMDWLELDSDLSKADEDVFRRTSLAY